MHTIEVDRCKRIIRVRPTGLYDVSGVQGFYKELRALLHDQFGVDPDYVVLLDLSAFIIQSQDAVTAFRDGLDSFPPARKIAVVANSMLARMQLRRVLARDYLRNFDDADEALLWLESA